jgi:hypothetical protein
MYFLLSPLSSYLRISPLSAAIKGAVSFSSQEKLAARGLEKLFFLFCCCVSFWFWQEIGFGLTYLHT